MKILEKSSKRLFVFKLETNYKILKDIKVVEIPLTYEW